MCPLEPASALTPSYSSSLAGEPQEAIAALQPAPLHNTLKQEKVGGTQLSFQGCIQTAQAPVRDLQPLQSSTAVTRC